MCVGINMYVCMYIYMYIWMDGCVSVVRFAATQRRTRRGCCLSWVGQVKSGASSIFFCFHVSGRSIGLGNRVIHSFIH